MRAVRAVIGQVSVDPDGSGDGDVGGGREEGEEVAGGRYGARVQDLPVHCDSGQHVDVGAVRSSRDNCNQEWGEARVVGYSG